MSRKSLVLAIAATVSLGAFALSSSTASAFHPAGGGGGLHAPHGGGGGGGLKFGGTGGLKFAGGGYNKFYKPWPTFNHHHWHWPRYWWWRHTWRRPYWVAPVIATGGVAAYAATTPSTNRCTCLTKEYTPQGQVVFKDVCTNEMAMNPPLTASPAAYAPQMPQQQGYLQPQAQP